ncbi:unnamed protein product [Mesocestoides corti]|uniref:NADP-dependent oxidoreductase domain-containing protein n=1 Tax=Mesocestoides corti TaxID=53468 RepID=A0A0R3UPG8_MESCO|nr:unnamed protein product [Mesocestoides corti]
MSCVPSIALNSGFNIPAIGFGTFGFSRNDVGEAVQCAIEVGFRHIDCAMSYNNEEEVGAAISKSLSSQCLAREDLFITSKVCNYVRSACELSLKHLGLNYLDLYLIHFPAAFHEKPGKNYDVCDPCTVEYECQSLEETWKAMECLVAEGLVKSIGVSNFNTKQLDRIISVASIMPAVNQIEVSVDLLNTKLIEYCHSKGIQVEAFVCCGACRKTMTPRLEEPFVKEIAAAHNKTAAQVLLRHALQRGLVVLSRGVTPAAIKSNFDVSQG